MSLNKQIQLNFSSILQVPIQSYSNEFTFVVNGKEFQTSRLISDLISPKISQIHSIDPTLDILIINTKEKGDFSRILQLVNFQLNEIEDNEVPFFTEVLQILCNDKIEIKDENPIELTKDNVIKELQKHESNSKVNSELYLKEIEFISTVMNELMASQEDELISLSKETLERILNNENLIIDSEDALLRFVNKLYKSDKSYSNLYEYVYFSYVTSPAMKEFTEIFDMNDITGEIWIRLCERLDKEIVKLSARKSCRHEKKIFTPNEKDPFSGIINYLRENPSTENEVKVTASSVNSNDEPYQPRTVILKENNDGWFISKNRSGSWLTIDFNEHRIIPTDYTIRSYKTYPNWAHPKSWVVEVSNDNSKWTVIDEVNNCSFLNGRRVVHTFKIEKNLSDEFRYFRFRQTGPNWINNNHLVFESIEVYGELI
ncbi:hypothetical protein M9Y10_040377 [Tritrichomonas musculus]|uniref:F5/8 type C domain-containing protein n=1 Tax=Tritrichomonas musculus TaxID=1915356 RepID=A0ABR2GPF7_9EUKA